MKEVNRKNLRIVSKDGMCYIYVDLTSPINKKDEVWSKIRLKLNEAKMTLPPGVLAILVMDDFSAISSSLIALESDDKGYVEMKDYADKLADELREIPELAAVKIYGAQDEEIAFSAPRPTLPRSWWSWLRPKRCALIITITDAFGTSTPTSMTVVDTSMSALPAANASMLKLFSSGLC